jgi:hypothetical protein
MEGVGKEGRGRMGGRTCVYLAADDERSVSNARLHDGTVLCGVIDDLVFAPFNVFAGRGVPGVGEEAEGFEFIACGGVSYNFPDYRWDWGIGDAPQYDIMS